MGNRGLRRSQLLGLKKKHFDQYSKIHKITSLSEWIGYILKGKPIVLKKGFDQATIQGLVAICNKTLEVAADHEDEYITVGPDQDNLVFTYYPAWSENRNRANNCQ